ncbi:MAG: arsenate reductase (azurin) large subunit [Parvularcula sp.]
MTYKRQIDRLPIPPKDANVHNVTCHYCIVGCGYKAYTWDRNKQGTRTENALGVDLGQQQGHDGVWLKPSQYNIVKQNGKDVHLAIYADADCEVNAGLSSVRGGRMGEGRPSDVTGTQKQRLRDPMVWKYGSWVPTSWDDALDLVAQVTARVITEGSEDDLIVSMFDHGGSAGGYENTWGTGKLYFQSMKIKHCRIHNRPAYNSEVHSSRDMGVDELNYSYSDYQSTDTIVMWGANPLECQTNLFLNHMKPGLQNGAKFILVDPRRTVTLNACETIAGQENTLHLAIREGTDIALANAIMTILVDEGWVDRDYIANNTLQGGLAERMGAAHPASLGSLEEVMKEIRISADEAAETCGVSADDIRKAAAWMAEPKNGTRRKTIIGYEKGIIWGNDNYRAVGALVNIGLATGNIGREGGGVCRMGGHQEGYFRPPEPFVGRPATYIDQMLINGGGKVHHIWACDHYKTTLNIAAFKKAYKRRTDIVKDAIDGAAGGSREDLVNAIVDAVNAGGLFVVDVDIIHSKIGQDAHVILPACEASEMNLTSMNGERRLRLSEKYMDPYGNSKPDCLIAAGLAQNMERVLRAMGDEPYADQFKGFDWTSEEDAFMDGYHSANPDVTYDRLRAMGNNGVQEPVLGYENGRLVGTKRLYEDGKFTRHGREDKKALFCASAWRGWQASGKAKEQETYRFWVNNGRANIFWQNLFLDQSNEFVMERFPYPVVEMNPDDMAGLGIGPGDLVELYNENGATQAMAYPTPTARPDQVFMVFANPNGPQGTLVNPGVNELVVPDYKHCWADIRKVSDAPQSVRGLSMKSKEFSL